MRLRMPAVEADAAANAMLVVDRVALLRRVPLFAQTPGRDLAGLAGVMDEVSFAIGDTVIRSGATEDWLFILTTGDVEVVRPDRRAVIRAVDVLGEFAVLDPQPRSADAVARTEVHALRLAKPAFDEALRERPEIARGVITALVRRLRERQEPG